MNLHLIVQLTIIETKKVFITLIIINFAFNLITDWGYGFGDGVKHGYNRRRYNKTDPFGSSRSSLYAGQRTFGDDDGSGRLSKYGYRGRGGLESDKWDRDSFGNLNQHRSGIQHGGTDKVCNIIFNLILCSV